MKNMEVGTMMIIEAIGLVFLTAVVFGLTWGAN